MIPGRVDEHGVCGRIRGYTSYRGSVLILWKYCCSCCFYGSTPDIGFSAPICYFCYVNKIICGGIGMCLALI
jgi:hypothetical protein